MDRETRETVDGWIVAEILKAKAVWLHAVYASILPRNLFNLAAQDNLEKPTAWAREQGYSIREYASANGAGETQIHKGALIVAKFKPVMVKDRDGETKLSFDAYVFGKVVPCASLTDHISQN